MKAYIKLFIFVMLLLLSGCGRNTGEAISGISEAESAAGTEPEKLSDAFSGSETTAESGETEELPDESSESETTFEECDPEELLDAFLANEIPAIHIDYHNEETLIMFDKLPYDEEDWYSYSVGERIDLDNDGENEQILDGPYGGMYLDARDGKVYVLTEGYGTAEMLSYTYYDNAVWIIHCDILHWGRRMYWLTKYDGKGNIVDEFQLSAEYWDSDEDRYDENSDFTYRDEKISMEEYEALRKEILGW